MYTHNRKHTCHAIAHIKIQTNTNVHKCMQLCEGNPYQNWRVYWNRSGAHFISICFCSFGCIHAEYRIALCFRVRPRSLLLFLLFNLCHNRFYHKFHVQNFMDVFVTILTILQSIITKKLRIICIMLTNYIESCANACYQIEIWMLWVIRIRHIN